MLLFYTVFPEKICLYKFYSPNFKLGWDPGRKGEVFDRKCFVIIPFSRISLVSTLLYYRKIHRFVLKNPVGF